MRPRVTSREHPSVVIKCERGFFCGWMSRAASLGRPEISRVRPSVHQSVRQSVSQSVSQPASQPASQSVREPRNVTVSSADDEEDRSDHITLDRLVSRESHILETEAPSFPV